MSSPGFNISLGLLSQLQAATDWLDSSPPFHSTDRFSLIIVKVTSFITNFASCTRRIKIFICLSIYNSYSLNLTLNLLLSITYLSSHIISTRRTQDTAAASKRQPWIIMSGRPERASKKQRRLSTDSEGTEDGYDWVGLKGGASKAGKSAEKGKNK